MYKTLSHNFSNNHGDNSTDYKSKATREDTLIGVFKVYVANQPN